MEVRYNENHRVFYMSNMSYLRALTHQQRTNHKKKMINSINVIINVDG